MVESYEFKIQKWKRNRLQELGASELLGFFDNQGKAGFGRRQAPDRLVYAPDLSEFYFCEVKGPTDRLRPVQIEYFKAVCQQQQEERRLSFSPWSFQYRGVQYNPSTGHPPRLGFMNVSAATAGAGSALLCLAQRGLVAVWTSVREVEIRHIAVVSGNQKSGVGAELVKSLLKTVVVEGCFRVHTIARNTSAGFFSRLGFTKATGTPPEHPDFKKHSILFELMERTTEPGGAANRRERAPASG